MNCKKNNLILVCGEILQDTAFVFVDEWEDDLPAEDYVCVKINFKGIKEGSVCLKTTSALARIFAQNMLAVDEDDSGLEEKALDAFKEIANILCGHILSAEFGENVSFKIFSPEIISCADFDKISDMKEFIIKAEDNPFIIKLTEFS